MKKVNLLKFNIFLVISFVLLFGLFCVPSFTAKADANYTVKFYNGDTLVDIITVNDGDSITAGQINEISSKIELDSSHRLVAWQTLRDGEADVVTIKTEGLDDDEVVIGSIHSDIIAETVITQVFVKVTFVMPNGSTIDRNVVYGDSLEGPIPLNLKFGERVSFDKDLENITENMTVNVTVDYTLTYIFVGGCILAIVLSITVITLIVLKAINRKEEGITKKKS